MKTLFRIIVLTLSPFTGLIAHAQDSTDEITKKFFYEFKSDTDATLDNLFATNKWRMENKDGTGKGKYQIREYGSLVGNYLGYEKIGEKSSSKSLKTAIYPVKYER